MRGTIVCGVGDTEESRGALELAAELSERLGLRLVIAHVVEGIAPLNTDGGESVTLKGNREGAARLLARLAAEHGVADRVEQRSAVGDPVATSGSRADRCAKREPRQATGGREEVVTSLRPRACLEQRGPAEPVDVVDLDLVWSSRSTIRTGKNSGPRVVPERKSRSGTIRAWARG